MLVVSTELELKVNIEFKLKSNLKLTCKTFKQSTLVSNCYN